jgi:hypothetical protein
MLIQGFENMGDGFFRGEKSNGSGQKEGTNWGK